MIHLTLDILTRPKMVSTKELVSFLKQAKISTNYINKLKIAYRPLICPFEDLVNYVKPGDNVCDIGCGSGQFCLLLAEFTGAGSLYGLEIDENLCVNANRLLAKYKDVSFNFDKYDGINFPDRVANSDIIFLIDVLHHVPKNAQDQFLHNLIGKMRKGARLIIKDMDGGSPLVYFNRLHDLIFSGEVGKELPSDRVIANIQSERLHIVSHQKRTMYVYPHYTIVATK